VENLDQLAARDSGRGGLGEVDGDISFVRRRGESVTGSEDEKVWEGDGPGSVREDDPGEDSFVNETEDLGDVIGSDDSDGDVVFDQRNPPHPRPSSRCLKGIFPLDDVKFLV